MNTRNPYDIAKGDQRPQELDRPSESEYRGPNKEALTQQELEEASILGAKIYTAAKRGNREFAHELVDGQIAALRPLIDGRLLDVSLGEVGIELRSLNTLESKGIRTVKQLLHADRAALLAIPNFGEVSLMGIFAQVTLFALNRAMDLEERLLVNAGRR